MFETIDRMRLRLGGREALSERAQVGPTQTRGRLDTNELGGSAIPATRRRQMDLLRREAFAFGASRIGGRLSPDNATAECARSAGSRVDSSFESNGVRLDGTARALQHRAA
jgi:hypothetical protein